MKNINIDNLELPEKSIVVEDSEDEVSSKKKPKPKRTVKQMILGILYKVALIYFLICAGLFFIQKYMIFVPTKGLDCSPRDYNLEFEENMLQSTNGKNISTWYMPARADKGYVLLCHGNGGHMGHRLPIADFLVNTLGLNVLFFDYQGYGNSEGSPGEKEFYMDGDTCMQFLKTKGATKDTTIIYGKSIGCGVAVEMALRHEAAGLVLESPPSSISDIAKKMLPMFPVSLLIVHRFDTLSKIPNVQIPLLAFHSPNDEVVPYSLGLKVFEAANQPKVFYDLDEGHNEVDHFSEKTYRDQWVSFLKKYISAH